MKKEKYFSYRNINKKASGLLRKLNDLDHKEQEFIFDKSALLVLDMQNYFTDKDSHAFIPSVDAIIGNINRLILKFESGNRPIIITQHFNNVAEGGMMLKWWNDYIKKGTNYFNVDRRIKVQNIKIIEKQFYDAFFNTELDLSMKEKSVQQVVICGVMTHLCCDSTARSAFMRNYQVFFTVDGTATYLESFHNSTIVNLSHGFVRPVITDMLIS